MKIKIGNLDEDAKKYEQVAIRIEDRFSFLVKDYNFTLQKKQVIYGVFLRYIRKEFTLSLAYGAPEFHIEQSVKFSPKKRCYLWHLTEFKFFRLDPEWLTQKANDNLERDMIFPYHFLKANIDILLEKSTLIEETLPEQDYVQ